MMKHAVKKVEAKKDIAEGMLPLACGHQTINVSREAVVEQK